MSDKFEYLIRGRSLFSIFGISLVIVLRTRFYSEQESLILEALTFLLIVACLVSGVLCFGQNQDQKKEIEKEIEGLIADAMLERHKNVGDIPN